MIRVLALILTVFLMGWKIGHHVIVMAWNPSDASADLSFSNGNLTATNVVASGTAANVRSTKSVTTGKYYFEIPSTTTSSDFRIGLADSTQSLTANLGASADAAAFIAVSGVVRQNGSPLGTGDTLTNGSAAIAVDIDAQLFWIKVGAGTWNANGGNPATGTGGFSFALTPPIFVVWGSSAAASVTANFGATQYSGTPPAGFGNF